MAVSRFDSQHKKYLGKAIGSQPPHIFAVADRMYRLLVSGGESQAIIVSGPSGSGKTETCKYVLRHLAYVSRDTRSQLGSKSSQELGDLLVRTNPLLEAFGNAETVLNKNSSRFGKFVQVCGICKLMHHHPCVALTPLRAAWPSRPH